MHFLDPTNDYAFKRVFGNESKKKLLMSFLNSLLKKEGAERIADVSLLDGEQVPHIGGLKRTLLDVLCQDQAGNFYIVEMQVMSKKHFDRRALYYASRAYGNQLELGDDYRKLNPVIFVGILGFEFTEGADCLSNHLILDVETGENVFKDFNFVLVELPKFTKGDDELDCITDQWIYFLKNARNLEQIPDVIREEAVKEAFEVVSRATWSPQELMNYNRIAMARCDIDMEIEFGYDRGRDVGREEGAREAMELMALRLLQAGAGKKLICDSTGLTEKQLQALQDPE